MPTVTAQRVYTSGSVTNTDPAWTRGLSWYQENTGVPAGTSLSDVSRADDYSYTSGGVVEAERITIGGGTGKVLINSEITFRNCEIIGRVLHQSGAGATFERCTFIGPETDQDACLLYGSINLTQCQMYGWTQGMKATGSQTIKDSWIYRTVSPTIHCEPILMEEADGVNILRCWLDSTKIGNSVVSAAWAAFGSTQPAGLHNIVFDGNHLMGSGYLIYLYDDAGVRATAPSNIQVTNNTFHESGPECYGSLEGNACLDADSLAMWSNNKRVVVNAGTDVGPPALYGA